jgi:hypothetical protein
VICRRCCSFVAIASPTGRRFCDDSAERADGCCLELPPHAADRDGARETSGDREEDEVLFIVLVPESVGPRLQPRPGAIVAEVI